MFVDLERNGLNQAIPAQHTLHEIAPLGLKPGYETSELVIKIDWNKFRFYH